MKKHLNIKMDVSVKNRVLIFSGILVLTLAIGSSIAIAGTFSEEYKSSNILENVTDQTEGSPKLESAPINPEFIEYQKKKTLTQKLSTLDGHKTGLIPSPVDLSHLSRVSAANESYPAYYDLRTLNRVTDVKNQIIGTCWIFATYASLESYLMPGENWDFSENNMKNLLSSAYPQGFDSITSEKPEGNMFKSTAYLARWSGPVSESDDPYFPNNWVSPENLSLKKHVQNVLFIPERKEPLDNNIIKWAVKNYGALDTPMHINVTELESYYYYNPAEYSYYCDNKNLKANHAVAIVGWNDSFDRNKFNTTPPGDGAFIVKNSWGKDFGENGYFYVSYYDSFIGSCNAVFTAENPNNYKYIYQYDPLGWTYYYEYYNTTGWCANVFTAKSDEVLKAVSFYTTDSSCNYEIHIYTNPESGPINQESPVLKQSGTNSTAGYHTVRLNSGVQLKAGQKFSVILKLTTPEYSYPIAIEYP